MITKEIALSLSYGQTLYHKTLRNSDGSALRARVTGQVKTWVRRPDAFRIPMKRGLYNTFYLDNDYQGSCHPSCWSIEEVTEDSRKN